MLTACVVFFSMRRCFELSVEKTSPRHPVPLPVKERGSFNYLPKTLGPRVCSPVATAGLGQIGNQKVIFKAEKRFFGGTVECACSAGFKRSLDTKKVSISSTKTACSVCLQTYGCGSKLSHQGKACFSHGFHLPGFHFGYPFLTHSHMFVALVLCKWPSRVFCVERGHILLPSGGISLSRRWHRLEASE